jgi:ribonuclease HI
VSTAIKVFTDGASKGNPGAGGIGINICDEAGNELLAYKEYIGETTNNFAEYTAILKSVDVIKALNTHYDVINFFSDSELMVRQLTGQYKIKHEELKKLSLQFWSKIKELNKQFTLTHVPRSENKTADRLANEAIEEYRKSIAL